jgi:hypothetical protein
MAGLVPATHALLGCTKDVGARHKAGHGQLAGRAAVRYHADNKTNRERETI